MSKYIDSIIKEFREQVRDEGVDEPMYKFYDRVEAFIIQALQSQRAAFRQLVKEAKPKGYTDEEEEILLKYEQSLLKALEDQKHTKDHTTIEGGEK